MEKKLERVYPLAIEVAVGWSKIYTLRFGQLMKEFFSWLEVQGFDPYYLEDEELFARFKAFVEDYKNT